MYGVELRVPIEKSVFEELLQKQSEHLPEIDIPREEEALRFVETDGSIATGRWIIVAIKWEGDQLMLGWPPMVATDDCGFTLPCPTPDDPAPANTAKEE